VSGLPSPACSLQCWPSGSGITVVALLEQAQRSSEAASEAGAVPLPPGVVCSEGSPSACHAGFYCPPGSISGDQMECGHSGVYCPAGSSLPTPVREGYYSLPVFADKEGIGAHGGRRQTAERLCPLGHYCSGGVRSLCPPGAFGGAEGLSSAACSGLCPPGHYCPQKSENGTRRRCPGGRYGAPAGLQHSACSGPCAPGYFCPEASTAPTERQCGAEYQSPFSNSSSNSNAVFCPEGSSVPLVVQVGYYSIGFNRTTRDSTVPCHPGSYCVNGIIDDCPAGRFGATERLASADCSGPCRKGHYCPPGSTSALEAPCPVGRYGDREGLGDASCSGQCAFPERCPLHSEVDFVPPDAIRGTLL
jgi:hypothetical protein